MKECRTTQGGRILSNLCKHMDVFFTFYYNFLMKNLWFRGFRIKRTLWCNQYLQLPGAELQYLSQQCPTQAGTCEDWSPSSITDIKLNSAGFSGKVRFQQCRISSSSRLRFSRTSASYRTARWTQKKCDAPLKHVDISKQMSVNKEENEGRKNERKNQTNGTSQAK